MKRWAKAGLVVAGYLIAIGAGALAGHLYDVRVSALPYDTSGGMYAAGESMAALGVFLAIALLPTLLMLWFLRDNLRLWQGVAAAAFAFASVGLVAVLLFLFGRGAPSHPLLALLSLLGLAQLLGVPLWTASFVLFAFLAQERPARRLLLAAVGIELVIGVCAAVHWFLPGARI